MDVRFTHASRRDLHEACAGAHFINRAAAAVAHGGTQTADHLIDDRGDGTLKGHHAFNAFRDELIDIALVVVLEVAVGRTLAHRAERTHAAVGLIVAALIKDHFARSFFRAGEHAAHHDRICAGRDGLGNIAREADAAVGDAGNTGALKSFCDIADG